MIASGQFHFLDLSVLLLFQIELQWMVMSCDPARPERETCEELPVSTKCRITKNF